VQQHQGYPVGKANCTSCHDPHGSSNPGILWASVHQPVAAKKCTQCHNEPGSAKALETKRAGLDLCRGCHAELVQLTFTKSKVHWPAIDKRACLNCHNPHAAKTKPLLKAEQTELCGTCHADAIRREARSLAKHQPVVDGQCSSCHQPHASDAQFLFVKSPTQELCADCHDWKKHNNHPIGDKTVDPRNKNLPMDCLSCHRTHGSQFKAFAHFDTKMDLCVQCHESLRR
jgi:predicted CXXCH cytochrome family protein